MKPKEDQHSHLKLIRKVFADLLSIVDTLHNDAKLCLLSMRPDRILISKTGDEYEPFMYDFSMASNLGGEDPDAQLANALSVYYTYKFSQVAEKSVQYLAPEV